MRQRNYKLPGIVVIVVLYTTVSSCSFLSFMQDPLVGTWMHTASNGYYDDDFTYHSLYAEETLVISDGEVITVESSLADTTYGGVLIMEGAGTYTSDDSYFSATLDLTRNDFGTTGEYTMSGSYDLDGNRLTILYDGQAAGTRYYRQ